MGETYLITGASRGLGRALVSSLLLRDNLIIIAAVRDLTSVTCTSLMELSRGEKTTLLLVKIDSKSDTDAQGAINQLRTEHRIASLDVVIACAVFGSVYGDLTMVSPQEVKDLIEINALGPLRLFQAARSLLETSKKPRFVLIGTPIASIAAMEQSPFPMVAYGASKAVAHYLIRKVHCEFPGIIGFVLDPGFMQTDMGNAGARHFGFEKAFVPVEDSTAFVLAQIGKCSKEDTSGKFVSIDETRGYIEW